jgi:hypothetical protein
MMLWAPTARVDVEKVAVPFDRAWEPRKTLPSRKVTVPVGEPIAGAMGETVVLSVTGWPLTDGFELEDNPAEVVPLFTSWVSTGEAALLKLLSPE